MAKPAEKNSLRIGDVAELLGLSPDTLRYYEKIGLLPRVSRNGSGLRSYGERDLSRLRFIQRAQKMGFSLTEIGMLLTMRDNPQRARADVRKLTAAKLDQVETHLRELTLLRNELRLLLNLCRGAKEGCPIIETIGREPSERS
ncbi:MAG: heavy metal-responsive transcriptional regulator [Thiobacillus sp. 65-29]|nr:MAG: heavy metal-responsive transcriptional regulator [Thiobacillus sp. 65-29]